METEIRLSPEEISVLKAIAEKVHLPEHSIEIQLVKGHVQENGLTNLDTNLAIRGLKAKEFIEYANHGPEGPEDIRVTDNGWAWIEKNKSNFLQSGEDVVPF